MSIDARKLAEPALAALETAIAAAKAGGDFVLASKLTGNRTALRTIVRKHEERPIEPTAAKPCEFGDAVQGAVLLVVELAIRTFSEANLHEHHMQKHRRVGDQCPVTLMAMRAHANAKGIKPVLPCSVQLTRIAPDALDVGDNLDVSCKHIRDGVAKWLGVNDRDERVQWPRVQQEKLGRYYGVRIEVRRAS